MKYLKFGHTENVGRQFFWSRWALTSTNLQHATNFSSYKVFDSMPLQISVQIFCAVFLKYWFVEDESGDMLVFIGVGELCPPANI